MAMRPVVYLVVSLTGCGYFNSETGKKVEDDIAQLKKKSATLDKQAADLQRATAEAESELKRLRKLLDEAQTAMKNSADLGLSVEKLKTDQATLTGRIDDLNSVTTALQKNFLDYRAQSDIKIEQAVSATTNQNTPPIPETADGIFSEAQRWFTDRRYADARRDFTAFVNRFPQDSRAPKVRYYIGDSYMQEKRWSNAIHAFSDLIDNTDGKNELVPDAMFKNGVAFYALGYCGDARTYFTELLKRYPKSEWKQDVKQQLDGLTRDAKNKAKCSK